MKRVVRKSTRASLHDARTLLETVLVAELVSPGTRLHVRSPWISDVVVVDNRAGRLSAIVPDMGDREIRFSEVLIELWRRGTRITIECRNAPTNAPFVATIQSTHGSIRLLQRDDLHEKLIAGDGFVLSGSMNFTVAGLDRNDEQLSLDSTLEVVARTWLELENAPHDPML